MNLKSVSSSARRSFWHLSILGSLAVSCSFARTPFVLKELNTTNQPDAQTQHVPLTTRIARMTREQLADAYVKPDAVASWLSAIDRNPQPLLDLVVCLRDRQSAGDPSECYALFMKTVAPAPKLVAGQISVATSAWAIPPPPLDVDATPDQSGNIPAASPGSSGDKGFTVPAASKPHVSMTRLADRKSEASETELDVERLLGNIRTLAPTLLMLENVLGKTIESGVFLAGIKEGLAATRNYITARRWHRHVNRPTTAIVMSGGAANGAFTAGFMWRLFEIMSSCRNVDGPQGCRGASINLVTGTSTGSLVGVTVDMYMTPGLEKRAIELLVDSYTCSVEYNLYCVNDTWDWNLFDDVRGLVQFDGIRKKLHDNLLPEMAKNPTELVAVSVDYESGDIFADSDQDPADAAPLEGRVDGVLASIVEPVLAEPIDGLRRNRGKIRGTFVDGGIRSGLPVMQAVDRGAERALIISTSSLDADPTPRPKNAGAVLMRTLDLMVQQSRVGEIQQAEFAALARRLAEYRMCLDRLRLVTDKGSPGDKGEVREYCERRRGFGVDHPTPKAAVSSWVGPQLFSEVAESWKTEWVFRPEETVASAGGFSFRPEVMRPLFEQGLRTFQIRCGETLRLLEIGGTLAAQACSEPADAIIARARQQFKPIAQCTINEARTRTCSK